jgi:hypothetical protein
VRRGCKVAGYKLQDSLVPSFPRSLIPSFPRSLFKGVRREAGLQGCRLQVAGSKVRVPRGVETALSCLTTNWRENVGGGDQGMEMVMEA